MYWRTKKKAITRAASTANMTPSRICSVEDEAAVPPPSDATGPVSGSRRCAMTIGDESTAWVPWY
jgi:hypothetical protein